MCGSKYKNLWLLINNFIIELISYQGKEGKDVESITLSVQICSPILVFRWIKKLS